MEDYTKDGNYSYLRPRGNDEVSKRITYPRFNGRPKSRPT